LAKQEVFSENKKSGETERRVGYRPAFAMSLVNAAGPSCYFTSFFILEKTDRRSVNVLRQSGVFG
jgi:hypothetical protein